MTISGAYGRDYSSKAAILADWNAEKDFMLRGMQSGYINKNDAEREGLTQFSVRYKKDLMQAILTCKNGKWTL